MEPARARPRPTRRASRSQAGASSGASVTTTPRQEPAGGGSTWAGRPRARPTATPSTVSRSHWPKLHSSRTPTTCPSGRTRDDVPMPPFQPRQTIPVPAPTAPYAGGAGEPAEARAAAQAAAT